MARESYLGGLHGFPNKACRGLETVDYAFALPYQLDLVAARQADGEHGFSVIGSHVHLAPVRLGNLAYDKQSKAETRPAVIAVILPKLPSTGKDPGAKTEVTETREDGTKDTYEADDSILNPSGKGDHIAVTETDEETGREDTYEADDSILNPSGKGEHTEVTESRDGGSAEESEDAKSETDNESKDETADNEDSDSDASDDSDSEADNDEGSGDADSSDESDDDSSEGGYSDDDSDE